MIKKILILLSKSAKILSLFGNEYVLISKLDSIGDYILFRNFLIPFKNSSFIDGKKIIFLANRAWKSIYNEYDFDFADFVIWVNVEKVIKSKLYRLYILTKLNCFKISIIIQPTFSRDSIIDFFLSSLSAKLKISQKGDDLNYLSEFKSIGDLSYDRLIESDDQIKFEFERNRHFFSSLDDSFARVELNLPFKKINIEESYISFFIGASAGFRQLSIDNLIFISKQFLEKTNFKILILGGTRESKHGSILENLSPRIISKCGKTSLVETIDLVGNSRAVLTMDSSGLHMAMATNVSNVYCFSNGNHIFRFVPYPENYKQLKVFFPPLIQKYLNSDKELLYTSFSRGSVIPINTIDVKSHIEEIFKDL